MNRLFTLLILTPFCIGLAHADLDFDSKKNVYKAKPEETSFESVFEFKNTGKYPIIIKTVDSNCGCISASADKERYKKGESGKITAQFKIGSTEGIQTKSISVVYAEEQPVVKPKVIRRAPEGVSNIAAPAPDPQPAAPIIAPSITDRLTVQLHVPSLVNIEPKITKWTIGDPAEAKTIRVTMDHKDPIRLLTARSSRDNMTITTKEIEAGKVYELELTPTSTEKVQLGMVTLETDCAIKKHRKKLAFFSIQRAEERQAPPAPDPAGIEAAENEGGENPSVTEAKPSS